MDMLMKTTIVETSLDFLYLFTANKKPPPSGGFLFIQIRIPCTPSLSS